MSDNSTISSAELTALWRSQYPELSNDIDSQLLVSTSGIEKAATFISVFNAKLIPRLVSVRAGYMLAEATRLLNTNKYDGCISLASGFSLLVYQVAKKCSEVTCKFYDSDLPDIIELRQHRISSNLEKLHVAAIEKTKAIAFDIEKAYASGTCLKEFFADVERPVFIVEGIIYFLSESCAYWLYEQIASFSNAAIIMDYWPISVAGTSKIANRVIAEWDKLMPEKSRNSYINKKQMQQIRSFFSGVSSTSTGNYEAILCEKLHQQPQLVNSDEFFPIHLLTATTNN